jgi:hypothetical protein
MFGPSRSATDCALGSALAPFRSTNWTSAGSSSNTSSSRHTRVGASGTGCVLRDSARRRAVTWSWRADRPPTSVVSGSRPCARRCVMRSTIGGTGQSKGQGR